MSKPLAGVLAVAHTPFNDDDTIDADSLRRAVDWAYSVGADGVGTGMVSEVVKLTGHERSALTAMLVEFSDGRGPVFAAVGGESTRQTLVTAASAVKAGARAVMATPPLTGRLTDREMTDHYRALAEAVEVPVIVQDASG